VTTGLVLLVVAVVVVVAGKVLADRAATEETEARAEEVRELLEGTTPEDFLALNAEQGSPDDVARAVQDQPDFVNVRATADLSFIRFQPDGWWAGFTERCVVAEVRAAGVRVTVPKTACVRVVAPDD
jgi:Tfp pilus assembly protein FimT